MKRTFIFLPLMCFFMNALPAQEIPESRDPTQAQGELRKLLSKPEAGASGPIVAPPALPAVTVKGRLITRSGGSAILALDEKQTMFVRAGKLYSLAGANDITLRVLSIDRHAVELEFQPSGRKMLLP